MTATTLTTLSTNKVLRYGLGTVLGVALLTASAKISVPFIPVPMTLQTLAVMGLAVALGPRFAVAIFAAYLAAGAAGLPVFAGTPLKGIGLAYMAGPTGGFLAGMLIASGVIGHLAAGRGMLGRLGALLGGTAVIYALGLAWMAVLFPLDKILAWGFYPFIFGDLMKVAIVAVGASAVSGLMSRFKKSDS